MDIMISEYVYRPEIRCTLPDCPFKDTTSPQKCYEVVDGIEFLCPYAVKVEKYEPASS